MTTKTYIQKSLEILTKTVALQTGVKDIHIELCSDGFLVDHIGTQNEKVLEYFKGCELTDFEYDAECNCSYYNYAK